MNKKLVLRVFAFVIVLAVITTICFLIFRSHRSKKLSVEDVLLDEIEKRINDSVDPCDDFYEYACGNWGLSNPLTKGKPYFNGELKISESISKEIHDAMLSSDSGGESLSLKMTRSFYKACLDESKANKDKGLWLYSLISGGKAKELHRDIHPKALQWPLIQHDYIPDGTSVERKMGYLKSVLGVDTLLYPFVLGSDYNTTKNVIWLTGAMLPLGMGMGYFTDPAAEHIRKAYSTLQSEVALLLGRDGGLKEGVDQEDLHKLLEFEIEVAKVKKENRDDKSNDEITLQQLIARIPGFKWGDYFGELLSDESLTSLKEGATILNTATSYMNALQPLLEKTEEKVIQNYLIWRLVLSEVPHLSDEYKSSFQRFQRILTGTDVQFNQTEICIKAVKGNYEVPSLGIAATEALLKNGFNQKLVTETNKLTKLVENGLMDLINSSQWMDMKTKERAMLKLDMVEHLIGYPNIVLNSSKIDEFYKDLSLSAGSPFGLQNLLLRSWGIRQDFELLAHPNTRTYFRGSPVLTNAWYMNEANSINIPLGEIHFPTIGEDFPNWARFGGLGSLIGHELSHGFFDPNGAEYDENGNLNNWWTEASKQLFKENQQCLIDQFSTYCYDNSTCINGELTLSENSADLAGVRAAYQTFGLKDDNKRVRKYTTQQLFFLSYPVYFCGVASEEENKKQFRARHSPLKYRVNGILRNIQSFSDAFKCSEHSYMNLKNKCL